MYIDKIYTKLYSNKDWNGLNTLINEMRSFTRGIEKYKDFYEPGYDLIKAYRHEAAKRLLDKKHAPGYNPNDAFKAMQEAHNEANESPEIAKLRKKVADQAISDLHDRFRNSKFYKPEDDNNIDSYHKHMNEWEDSFHNQIVDKPGGWENRSQLNEFYGPAEFQRIDRRYRFNAPYPNLDWNDDPDLSSGSRHKGSADPMDQAYLWDNRKDREYEKADNKTLDEFNRSMNELDKERKDVDNTPRLDSMWDKITGKYKQQEQELNAKRQDIDRRRSELESSTVKRRNKIAKDRDNKSGIR